jgi:hypothetical protein
MQVRGPGGAGVYHGGGTGDVERPDAQATHLEGIPDGAVVRPHVDTAPAYILGLDLGQAADYAALAITERAWQPTGAVEVVPGEVAIVAEGLHRLPVSKPVVRPVVEPRRNVLHLEQWEIGTRYTQVVADVLRTIDEVVLPANPPDRSPPVLVVDYTGVGRAVVDIFLEKHVPIPLIAVTTSSGETSHARPTGGNWSEWVVPKKELVAPLLVAMQNTAIKVAPTLLLQELFAKQAEAFRMKVRQSGGVSYEAQREVDHDDLVVAVALTCWVANMIDLASK